LQNDHIKKVKEVQCRGEGQGWRVVECQKFKKYKVVPPSSTIDFLVVAQVTARKILFK